MEGVDDRHVDGYGESSNMAKRFSMKQPIIRTDNQHANKDQDRRNIEVLGNKFRHTCSSTG